MFVTLQFDKNYTFFIGMVGKCWWGGEDRKPSKLADIDISSPSGSNWILIQPSMHARKWYPGGKPIWTCENIFRACSSSPDAQLAPIIGWRLTWEQQMPNIPTDYKLQNDTCIHIVLHGWHDCVKQPPNCSYVNYWNTITYWCSTAPHSLWN